MCCDVLLCYVMWSCAVGHAGRGCMAEGVLGWAVLRCALLKHAGRGCMAEGVL